MHAQRDHLLVVRAVEDADPSARGQRLGDAPQEVVVELLRDGFLNQTTWTPCGLTPDITCSIALSLPAASIAWKTTSSA